MDTKYLFMVGVLGEEGAKALRKAAGRSKPLDNVLLPRTILAWLDIAARFNHEGELPGVDNTYLAFSKSENGVYSGSITIGDEVYGFEDSTKTHIASAIAVSLGHAVIAADEKLRDHDLANLGKNIDLLAKAHAVAQSIEKAEPPGPAAPPVPQGAPQAAQGARKQPRIPRPPTPKGKQVEAPPAPKLRVRIPGLKPKPIAIAKAQAERPCGACGGKQFKDGTFKGCICFKEMSKSVSVEDAGSNLLISFGSNWDSDAIATLLEALGVK